MGYRQRMSAPLRAQGRTLALAGMAMAGIFMAGTSAAQAEDGFSYEGNLTGTFLAASDDRARPEPALSGDLFGTYAFGDFAFVGHLEGSTTPRANGVSSLVPNANADSGSALNGVGHGRVQLSEFYLQFGNDDVTAAVGLIDATAWLDASAVANDEHSQFLNATLVNNPTIAFPDYTLGGVVALEGHDAFPGITAFVGSSNGLADNPDADYDELFDVGDTGKGIFGALELQWAVAGLGETGAVRIGAWTNTADFARLNGTAGTKNNYGVYGVIDGNVDELGWSIRAGMADKSVSPAAWFIGGAVEHPLGPVTVGLGLTHTAASGDLGAGFSDETNAELYARYDAIEHLHITPLVQWTNNPGFDDTGTAIDESVVIFGVRVGVDI